VPRSYGAEDFVPLFRRLEVYTKVNIKQFHGLGSRGGNPLKTEVNLLIIERTEGASGLLRAKFILEKQRNNAEIPLGL
jgi:hypothetical protein